MVEAVERRPAEVGAGGSILILSASFPVYKSKVARMKSGRGEVGDIEFGLTAWLLVALVRRRWVVLVLLTILRSSVLLLGWSTVSLLRSEVLTQQIIIYRQRMQKLRHWSSDRGPQTKGTQSCPASTLSAIAIDRATDCSTLFDIVSTRKRSEIKIAMMG